MAPSNFRKLSVICLISTTVPSALALTTALSAAKAIGLFPRQTTCGGNSALQQCGPDFPSSFCCPQSSSCISLNNTISEAAICCPEGQDCKFIQPITCDVGQLDATKHPENQIHIANTTNLKLPTCGSGTCCPLGYTCNGNMCSAVSAAAASSTSSSTPGKTSAPTGTNVPAASQTSASTPAIPTQAPRQSSFPAKAVVAGFFPGMILGALLTLLIIYLIKKRREAAANRYSGDFGHVARTVSDPIYDPVYAARTDFLRRGNGSQASPSSTTEMTQTRPRSAAAGSTLLGTPRVRSLFSRSPKLPVGVGTGVGASLKPATSYSVRDPYKTPNQTPSRVGSKKRMTVARSGSTETIDVLMPAPSFLGPPKAPGMRGERPVTQETTFTSLMEGAGFGRESREGVRGWQGGSPMRKV